MSDVTSDSREDLGLLGEGASALELQRSGVARMGQWLLPSRSRRKKRHEPGPMEGARLATQQATRDGHDAPSGLRAVGRLARRHPVLVFFFLAYLISWSWWVPLAVRGEVVRAGVGWPTHLPGLLGPAIAAVWWPRQSGAALGWVTSAVARCGGGSVGCGGWLWRPRSGWPLLAHCKPCSVTATLPRLAEFTRYTGVGSITPDRR